MGALGLTTLALWVAKKGLLAETAGSHPGRAVLSRTRKKDKSIGRGDVGDQIGMGRPLGFDWLQGTCHC